MTPAGPGPAHLPFKKVPTSRRVTVMVALAMASSAPSAAQDRTPDKLRVSINQCRCDTEHLRREITWVTYVRDQSDAQVHILGSSQRTGGGREWTFNFIGQNELDGQESTLQFRSSQTDTENETRDGQTRVLAVGLLHFAALAGTMPAVTITVDAPENAGAGQPAQSADDPWNAWVFSVGAGGNVNGEELENSFSVNGSWSADRITENWKLEFDASGRFSRRETELTDSTYVNNSHNWDFSGLIVKSITNHWSAGTQWETAASTFSNQDLRVTAALAVEYSVFDYAESSRRQLTLLYGIGPAYFDWEEITIYGQTEELRVEQNFLASFGMLQPWGNANFFGSAQSFLHDLSLHELRFGGGLDFRITRGLNLGVGGSVSRIQNQISLQRGTLSDADILVRRRQVATSYRYRMNFNLRYRFGSIFNDVVNTRIDF